MIFQERYFKSLSKGININSSIRMTFPDGNDRILISCSDKLVWVDIVEDEICLREITFSNVIEDYRVCALYGLTLLGKSYLYIVRTPGSSCPDTRCHILGYTISIGQENTFEFSQFLDFGVDYNPVDMKHIEYDGSVFMATLGSDKALHVYELDVECGILRRGDSKRDLARASLVSRMRMTPSSSLAHRFLMEEWDGGGSQCIVGLVDGHIHWDRHVPTGSPAADSARGVTEDSCESVGNKDSTGGVDCEPLSSILSIDSCGITALPRSPLSCTDDETDMDAGAFSPPNSASHRRASMSLLDLVIAEGNEDDEDGECADEEGGGGGWGGKVGTLSPDKNMPDRDEDDAEVQGGGDPIEMPLLSPSTLRPCGGPAGDTGEERRGLEGMLRQLFLGCPFGDNTLTTGASSEQSMGMRSSLSTCSVMEGSSNDDATVVNRETGSSRHSFLLDGSVSCFQFYSRESSCSSRFRHKGVAARRAAAGIATEVGVLPCSPPSPSVIVGMSEGDAVLLSIERGFNVENTESVCLKSLCLPHYCSGDVSADEVDSHDHGCVLAACACDVTGDGCNEVVLGYASGLVRVLALVDTAAVGDTVGGQVDTCESNGGNTGLWSDSGRSGNGYGLDDAHMTGEMNCEGWSVDTCEFRDIGHMQLPFPVMHISYGQLLGRSSVERTSRAQHANDDSKLGEDYSYSDDQCIIVTSKSVHVLVPKRWVDASICYMIDVFIVNCRQSTHTDCNITMEEKLALVAKILSGIDTLCKQIPPIS